MPAGRAARTSVGRGALGMKRLSIQRALHLLDPEAFDDVTGAHVLIAFEGHAAFLSDLNFSDFVREALERRERAFVDDDVVADEAHLGAPLHRAFGDAAAGDLADLGDVELL